MIKINTERCNGCGECVEVCPTGAVYLVGGKATVDGTLCRECEACIAACPTGAIVGLTEASASDVDLPRIPALRPEPEMPWVQTEPLLVPLRSRVLPVVSAALVWAGREIVPRLAEHLLYDLDRRVARRQTPAVRQSTSNGGAPVRGGGSGRRWRRRRRGG